MSYSKEPYFFAFEGKKFDFQGSGDQELYDDIQHVAAVVSR
jgi:hypothetical protein